MTDWTPRERAIVERAAMELWPDDPDLEYNLQGLASIAQEIAQQIRKADREPPFKRDMAAEA